VSSLLLTAVACGSGESPGTESAGSTVSADPTCSGEPGPISVDDVIRVLTEAGFSVFDEGVAICDGLTPRQDILGGVTNEGSGAYEEVQQREGIVTCTLFRGSVGPSELEKNLHEPAYSPVFVGRKAKFRLKNMSCLMYAGDEHQDAQVAKLDGAMTRLAELDLIPYSTPVTLRGWPFASGSSFPACRS
jgi:hypothetical protein